MKKRISMIMAICLLLSLTACGVDSGTNSNGKLDYSVLKPALFEMPTYQYLKTGEVLGKCMSMGGKEV